jgi:hypothetical protein
MPESGDKTKSGDKVDAGDKGSSDSKPTEGEANCSAADSKDSDAPAHSKEKEPTGVATEPEKKPLFTFPSMGTTAGFGSFGAGFGSFGATSGTGTSIAFGASASTTGAFGGASFGSFGSSSSFSFSFSNAPTQADAFKAKKKEDGEDGGEEGGEDGGEDNEKEVPVEKTCQLEEVETSTGEEEELNVFQARCSGPPPSDDCDPVTHTRSLRFIGQPPLTGQQCDPN